MRLQTAITAKESYFYTSVKYAFVQNKLSLKENLLFFYTRRF